MISSQKPARKKHPLVFPSILLGIGCALIGASWWALVTIGSDTNILEQVTYEFLFLPVLHVMLVVGAGIALLGLGILIHRIVKQQRMIMR